MADVYGFDDYKNKIKLPMAFRKRYITNDVSSGIELTTAILGSDANAWCVTAMFYETVSQGLSTITNVNPEWSRDSNNHTIDITVDPNQGAYVTVILQRIAAS